MKIEKSISEYKKACTIIPGGVNSPVRAFKSVGGNPVLIHKASGSKIYDIDGNEYIDYVNSWGALILGHAHPSITDAITKQVTFGISYGAPTVLETKMAELIIQMMPSIEMVRMVNSGTEATMSAIRLARGYTGRNKIIKFAGCYHGHADSFLIKAGSGAITLSIPDNPNIPQSIAKDTLITDYNNLPSVENLFNTYPDDIAAVIVEPVAANMGVVLPDIHFLRGLRKLTTKYNALLIFDEVITGFRLTKGGAQEYYGISPDLTTLGKIIGGGLPVGAYGGKKEIMERIAPVGPVYQAGTMSGNPLVMAAGIATIETLNKIPNIYTELKRKTKKLSDGLITNLQKTGIKGVVNQVESLITLFFNDLPEIRTFDDVMKSNKDLYTKYFHLLLENGIYLAPSQFEASFISYAHTDEDIDRTIEASYLAMQKLL